MAQVEKCADYAKTPEIQAVFERYGAIFREVAEGGVLRTLFEMAKEENFGLTVDENLIPIHQETIEICEYLDLNPYTITSRGTFVVVSEKVGAILAECQKSGIRAEIIGETVPGKKKTLLRYGEAQCLNRPKKDPLRELGILSD